MWNQIVWEIAPLDRDRVTAVDFVYSLPKNFPDPGDRTILDIDRPELPDVCSIRSPGCFRRITLRVSLHAAFSRALLPA